MKHTASALATTSPIIMRMNISLCAARFHRRPSCWPCMPVLDVRKLSKAKLTILGTACDAVSKKELCPIAQLNADKVDIEIDGVICKVLDLPDLGPIRVLLSRELGAFLELANRNRYPLQRAGQCR